MSGAVAQMVERLLSMQEAGGSMPPSSILSVTDNVFKTNCTPVHRLFFAELSTIRDTVAERLRRRPAKPLGSARVGSNPIGVVFKFGQIQFC